MYIIVTSGVALMASHAVWQHDAIVSKVKLHTASSKLITACSLGDVNVFDLRNMKRLLGDKPLSNEGSTAVECHPLNELVAM